ncbi:hypothetical protein DENSPDRAFT_880104 [Dentipellis sp. KUC8613]|nr:hypothetical protein DENSPDRAFT_880104 [Dentipellis sp. KUC8613]
MAESSEPAVSVKTVLRVMHDATLAILSHACRRRFRRVGQHVQSVGQAQRAARAAFGVATRETRVWRRSEGAILSRKSPAPCLAPRSLVLQSSQAARAIVRSAQVHVTRPSSHWRSPLAAGARIHESWAIDAGKRAASARSQPSASFPSQQMVTARRGGLGLRNWGLAGTQDRDYLRGVVARVSGLRLSSIRSLQPQM